MYAKAKYQEYQGYLYTQLEVMTKPSHTEENLSILTSSELQAIHLKWTAKEMPHQYNKNFRYNLT